MLSKKEQRLRRARQTRIRIAQQGVARLTVNRTNLHIYAAVISEDGGKVIASASTVEAEMRSALGGSGKGGNAAAAQPASKKWHLIAQALRTTAASRRSPRQLAKRVCSSKRNGKRKWLNFNPECKTKVATTACARR